jgi:hypothetical protein
LKITRPPSAAFSEDDKGKDANDVQAATYPTGAACHFNQNLHPNMPGRGFTIPLFCMEKLVLSK